MDDLITRARTALWGRRAVRARAPVPLASQRANSWWDPSDTTSVHERVYEAYGSVGTLFAICRQIYENFASVDWHLYRRTSVRDKTRRQEILGSSFMDVWDLPNAFMTGRFFRESAQQHLDLVGETDIVLVTVGSVVVEMWPVRPDKLHPIKDPNEFLTGWMYHGPDGEQVPLARDQVIQIKLPNPSDPYRGLGPVQAMLADVDAARYSAEWNRNFFINGARPGGIITVDHRMQDDELEDFIARWRRQHQGIANAHRVAVLENATWQDVNFSMEDMQFAELRNLPRELIREAFAFPKPMLGTVEDVNRANAQAGKTIMAETITTPRLARWRDTVNAFLLPRFAGGKAQMMDFDDPTPMDHEQVAADRTSKAQAFKTLIDAGVDPDDAAMVAGLPAMRMRETAPAAPQPPALPAVPQQPALPTRNRSMPVIDVDSYWSDLAAIAR